MPVFEFMKNGADITWNNEKKQAIQRQETDLLMNNGQNYGKISVGGLRALQNGTINTYTPINETERKTIENFKNNYRVNLTASDGKPMGSVSYRTAEKFGQFANQANTSGGFKDKLKSSVEAGKFISGLTGADKDAYDSYMAYEQELVNERTRKEIDPKGIAKKYGLDAAEITDTDVQRFFASNPQYGVGFKMLDGRPFAVGSNQSTVNDADYLFVLGMNNYKRKLSNKDAGGLEAFAVKSFESATFGLNNLIANIVGKKEYEDKGLNPDYFITNEQAYAKTIESHPYASAGGSITGTLAPTLGIGTLIKGGLKAVGMLPAKKWAQEALVQGLTGVVRGGVTTATSGGDLGDIALGAFREGLTGGVGGAVGGKVDDLLGKVLTNPKYASTVLGKLKDLRTTAYVSSALSGIADATTDFATDKIVVNTANSLGADLQHRTGTDLVTDFAVSLMFGMASNLANAKNVSAQSKAHIEVETAKYLDDYYKIVETNLKADDPDSYIKTAESLIERGNELTDYLEKHIFTGQKDYVNTIKETIEITNTGLRESVEGIKAETSTGVKSEKSIPSTEIPATTPKVNSTTPVSTEGGIVTSASRSIDNIVNGKATNADYDLFKVGQAENRKAFEDATGVKLPATNSETRKFLRDFVNKSPVERVLSDIPEAQRNSIIETANKIAEGTEKTSEQLVAEVKGISDNVSATIKNQFGIEVDNGRLLEINLKALADNPENIITNDFVRGYSEVIGEKLKGINPKTLENNYFGKAPLGGKLADYGNKFKTVVDSSAQTLKTEYEGMPSTKVDGNALHTVNTEYHHMYDVNKVEQGFVDSVNSEIEQAVENIRSGNVEKVPDNIEVTKLTDKTIEDLSDFVGFDVSDYSVKIERDRLNHIEKRHGINGNHDKSLSDPQDMARMGYVINNYDDISWLRDDDGNIVFSEKYNSKNNEASPILMMTKKIDGTYCLSYVVPDSKKKTLWITSARIQKADVGSQVPNSNNAPLRQTSETPLVSSSANNNIPQKADTVKNEYMTENDKITDNSENGFTRIDDIDDSFGVRISEGKNEYGNDVLKIDIDNPDVDAVVDSAEYKKLIENSFEIKETKGVTLTAERAFEKAFGKNYEDFRKVVYDNLDKSKLQYMNVLDFLTKGLEENVINRGITKGSKDSELLQKYGEGLITQAELMSMTNNWRNIVEADRYIRKMYDSLIDSVNDTKKKIYPHIEEQEADLKKDLAKVNEQLDLIEQGKLDVLPISKSNKVLRAQELEKALKTIDGNSKLTIKGLEGQIDNIKNTMAGKKNKSTKVYAELETRLSKLEAKKQRLEEYFNLSKNQKLEKLNSLLGEYENSDALSVGISKKTKEDLIAKRKRIEDELYDETRWRGKRIPKRKDYYHHFQEFSNSILGELLNRKNSNISAELVLVSEHTKPRSKWESFAQRRKGETTQYDAVAGYLDYIDAAAYAMTIDPNISIIRKLTDDIVHETSSSNTNTHGTNNANATIQRLDALANELSGKTVSQVDRVVQDAIGRKNFRIAKNVVNRMKSSSIVGNIGSSVVQVSNLPNAVGTLKYKSSLITALTDSWTEWKPGKNKLSDAFMNRTDIQKKSPFLRERYFDVKSQFDTGVLANAQKLANWMLTVGDEFSTRLTWNAFYREAQKVGVENPIQYADSKTRKCVGGRGLGEKSLAQQSATLTAAFPFTLEVSNAWQVQKDLGKDLFKGIKSGDIKSAANGVRDFLSLYVATAVLSAALNEIRGSDGGMFNPIGIIYNNICDYFFGDDEDKENNIFLKTAQEVTGNFVGSLPVGQKVAELWPENGMEIGDTKIASRSDLFGSEDPTRYGTSNLITSAIKHPLTSFIPGGAQIRKTAGAVEVLKDGGVYDNKGNLKYPVERNAENYVKGLLFGKSAFDETKDFYADDRSALSEKQTAEFRNRVANGENPQDVYNNFMQQREADKLYTQTVYKNVKPFDTTTADALTEIYEEYQNIDADAHSIGVPKATRVFKYKGKSYDLTAEQYAELQNRYNTEYYAEITKILNNNNLSVEKKYKKIAEIRSDVMSDVKSQFYREFLR